LPNLPKTRNEVHNVLEEIDIIYENEQFLLYNDIESGIVLFSTKTNLEFLLIYGQKKVPAFIAQPMQANPSIANLIVISSLRILIYSNLWIF